MFQIIRSRVIEAVPLLLILSIVSFTMVRALPGDPVEALIGESTRDISREQLKYLRKEFGLDDPIPIQYSRWLLGWFGKGELGRSYQDNRPVLEVITERFPATILLTGAAIFLSFSLGIFWGLTLMIIRRGLKFLETTFISLTLFIYSIPSFLAGLAVIFLATYLDPLRSIPIFKSLEPSGSMNILSLIPFVLLPAISLAIGKSAKIALFIRALALDEINKSYVTTAVAKGLPQWKVLLFHVCKNCLPPVINLLALSLPALIGGSVLIETIFGWPGTGRLAVDATFGRNYPVMTCIVMIYGSMVILANLLADIITPMIDPRQSSNLLNSQKSTGTSEAFEGADAPRSVSR